jgi:hypothetical protein
MKEDKGQRLYCTKCGRWTWIKYKNGVYEPRNCAHIPLVAKLCVKCFEKQNKLK